MEALSQWSCAHDDAESFRTVQQSLSATHKPLQSIHAGAHHALLDTSNPEAIAQSAHSLRELVEKLPRHFDLPQSTSTGKPKEHVRNLMRAWSRAKEKSQSYTASTGAWFGSIDNSLNTVFTILEQLAAAVQRHNPDRAYQAQLALRALDATGARLPPTLEKQRVREWRDFDKLFQDVCHHQAHPTKEAFMKDLERFDRFIARLVRPSVAADFTALDDLISSPD